ncbi:MAG TPA: hypothetical protein VFE70_04740, partial [Candidatus Elarobacter sp.]|nr:hypothetical protein [Candidatus Elarobacter sp.]
HAHADAVVAARRRFDRLGTAPILGEERELPLALAEELAYAGDVLGARAYVKRFDEQPPASRMRVREDPRERAHRSFVEAVIADAAGEDRAAHAWYRRAFGIYRRIGYERRAVLAALRLGELTGNPHLLEYAETTLRKRARG